MKTMWLILVMTLLVCRVDCLQMRWFKWIKKLFDEKHSKKKESNHCSREGLQKATPEYILKVLYDKEKTDNNSVLYTGERIGEGAENFLLEIFLKESDKKCDYFHRNEDQELPKRKCVESNILQERVKKANKYSEQKGRNSKGPITFSRVARCVQEMSAIEKEEKPDAAYFLAYEIPRGIPLRQMCLIKGSFSQDDNCHKGLRSIAANSLKILEAAYSEGTYYTYGSITPDNVFFSIEDSLYSISFGPVAYNEVTYDSESLSPFAEDFNNLGVLLLSCVIGEDAAEVLQGVQFHSAADVYRATKKYFDDNFIQINLFREEFGFRDFTYESGLESIEETEFDDNLKGSVFDLVFNLLLDPSKSKRVYSTVKSALEHQFVKEILANQDKIINGEAPSRNVTYSKSPSDI